MFVDSAYNGSVRMLYDGYVQLVHHYFYSWDRGTLEVPSATHAETSQPLTELSAPVSRRRRSVRARPCRRSSACSFVIHQPALAALRCTHDIKQQGVANCVCTRASSAGV